MFDIGSGIDLSKEKVRDESDGEKYFFINVVSGRYHPGGSSCTYKGETVPFIVEFSKGRDISGHILRLLVDGCVSRFDLGVLKYICDKNNKWTVFCVPYGPSLWQVGDST